MNLEFWKNKRVFITGHTGFKGSWLSLWLNKLGANVTGFALEPPTNPSLFDLCSLDKKIKSNIGDIRNFDSLYKAMVDANPEIVIHMAAQPLVRESYKIPVETYAINVMGTVHVLEAVRQLQMNNKGQIKSVVNVTTDKCYENREWHWGYRESEPMGGYDPYSNSKGCSELVTSSYRNSYFNKNDHAKHGVAIASARAGNVIGGGDFAGDRLIPDFVRSMLKKENITIRSPKAIRPWQHVLEPLSGYLTLAEKMYLEGAKHAEGWNFGPEDADAKPVEWIVKYMCENWKEGASYAIDKGPHPHEANFLKLDCSKAKAELNWSPRWNLATTLDSIITWTKTYRDGGNIEELCLAQIEKYENSK